MERGAFERLVRDHQEMVFAVAFSYCRERAAAEDVAQEAFLKAYRSVDGMRNPGKMKTWLYSIARFTAIDWVRRNGRERPGEVPDRPAPRPAAAAEDRGARVMAAIRELPDDHREVMMLRYVQGLSYSEIARTIGSTPSAVGEKLHRIREKVRERLRTEVRS
jgi:RNA polymerase sigma-70 factor (ECF subfamily)